MPVGSTHTLQEKLDTLPHAPGVYRFVNKKGDVLYIGKASSLRNRVRSYFQQGNSDTRFFLSAIASEVHDLETHVVKTEKEAALLEQALIQAQKPKYNVKLKDDKMFVSLRLDDRVPWPRLEVVRKPALDHAQYFGPYDSATSARQTLRLINKHFQLRTCTDYEMANRKRPCLQYHIKRCPAPCVYEVNQGAYRQDVRNVALFLSGRYQELLASMRKSMAEASKNMAYEAAAVWRDRIAAVEHVQEKQHVVTASPSDHDVFGAYREADLAEVAVLRVRQGRLMAIETQSLIDIKLPDDEMISGFVSAYYEAGRPLPDEILLPSSIEACEGLQTLLAERKCNIRIKVPKKGTKASLIELAHENARHAFNEKARAAADIGRKLEDIQEALHLRQVPSTIECVDISHTGGSDTVGAMVAMQDGALDKTRYRSFTLRGSAASDDYGAMREVLSRRFKRSWPLPNLLVVDGGRGQLQVALTVLEELGLDDHLEVAALAKEKTPEHGETVFDRVYRPGQKNPVILKDRSPALFLLAQLRDEAHRFSNLHREKRASKRSLSSDLDNIEGIGQVTKTRLLRKLGSVHAVRNATFEDLLEAGVTRTQAKALISYFMQEAV